MTTYDKGKELEQTVAAKIRHKLDSTAKRDTRSGSNWHRRSDIFTALPFHIEVKNHKILKPKEWYRQASDSASSGQTPVVAFRSDEDVMVLLKFDDFLDTLAELEQVRGQLVDLRKPIVAKNVDDTVAQLERVGRVGQTCREGHITATDGYCLQKGCKFSRGYRPKKGEK